jgi:hypothetical protein
MGTFPVLAFGINEMLKSYLSWNHFPIFPAYKGTGGRFDVGLYRIYSISL